jgi:hypothetical protein
MDLLIETEKISKYILKLFAIVCTKQKLAQFELESLLTVNTNSKSEEESGPKEIRFF